MSRRAGAKSLYLVIAIGLALAPSGTDAADRLTGRARVIDGDTIEIAGTHIRLWGIDAPELNQICRAGPSAITRPSGGITNAGRPYRCGRDAAAAMLQLTRGRTIRCEPRDRDRYGRVVAVCRNEIVDLNAALVRLGWAMILPATRTAITGPRKKRRAWQGSASGPGISTCHRRGGANTATAALANRGDQCHEIRGSIQAIEAPRRAGKQRFLLGG